MNFEELIEAITIFRKYKDRNHFQEGFHAEHHEITAGLNIEDTDPEDAARLRELGWCEDEATGEGWAHYARL